MSPAPARSRLPERPVLRQVDVLTRRYWACTLGDPVTLLLLLAQAPFIGYLCTLVWGSIEKDTPSLYFVLCLSAVWFGCINACREVVKERAILERERFFGLSLAAYVQSKLRVLSAIGAIQVLMLLMAVEWKIALNGNFWLQLVALWGASLCGTGLGLLVSAFSKSQERAVGAIPLLILPQILFSEFSIPEDSFSTTVQWAERAMPVHWAFEIFQQAASTEMDAWVLVGALCVLPLYAGALGLLTTTALLPRREL